MEQWYQLVEITSSLTLTNETDALVWQLENRGVYSTSSLYHVINFRGVQPVFVPSVWKLKVPPKIHVFMWLLANNKLMTRDNLRKRHIIKPLECVFCSEAETCSHLFFDCVVSRQIWPLVSNHFGVDTGADFESVARLWIANKKHSALNTANAAVLWCIWKYRNSMIFNTTMWTSIKQVMRLILKTIKN